MIEVRDIEGRDADALGEIHAAAWQVAYGPFFEPEFAARAVQRRRTLWPERIDTEPGRILLAELEGRPLALSFVVPSSGRQGWAEIFSFYCHPDGWGTGAAGALMTGTLRRLRALEFARVHLWTLRDTPRSRRFYAKSGFTETGIERSHDFGDGNPLPQLEYQRAC